MPMTDAIARAVRFDTYGDPSVLYLAEIAMPKPGPGEVLVQVKAAGINPGETNIRSGALHSRFPATFPSGEGSDLAGIVVELGLDVTTFAVGDEVLGFSWQRSSHATYATVPISQLIPKPKALSWEVAASLYVAGCTAFAAVRAIAPEAGETVAVSAASGGVGALVVQLLIQRGVHVLGIASLSSVAPLTGLGATPIEYGDGLAKRLTTAAPRGIDAFIDLFGPEYVRLAVTLGIPRDRIETTISFEAAAELGTKADGSASASTTDVLSYMAGLIAEGKLTLSIAQTFPLESVKEAFELIEQRHTHGKIVLVP
jgi:NADPH:quinone reductase